jgi:hypothetical protein
VNGLSPFLPTKKGIYMAHDEETMVKNLILKMRQILVDVFGQVPQDASSTRFIFNSFIVNMTTDFYVSMLKQNPGTLDESIAYIERRKKCAIGDVDFAFNHIIKLLKDGKILDDIKKE